jgi:hypothetical protein
VRNLPRATEKQDVTVRVLDLEAPRAIVRVLERRVRQRRRILVNSLDEELCAISANDGKEWISLRLLKRYLKSKPAAVKHDGSVDIFDDEER